MMKSPLGVVLPPTRSKPNFTQRRAGDAIEGQAMQCRDIPAVVKCTVPRHPAPWTTKMEAAILIGVGQPHER